ncbi:MAG: M28 family peptidase [Acidobacteriota bacterium]
MRVTRWMTLPLPRLCWSLFLSLGLGLSSVGTAEADSSTMDVQSDASRQDSTGEDSTWLEEASRLVAAVLGSTPMVDDLRQLTDQIGGRPTGSVANVRSVAWAVERLRAAGVETSLESFEMPALWLETAARASVEGTSGATAEGAAVSLRFAPRVASMPWSPPTPEGGIAAPLVDVGLGSEDDFARVGEAVRDAFVLVETPLLEDLADLFAEYRAQVKIERRALAAGAAGVVYQGSRSRNVLYRHNASGGPSTSRPMVVMERDGARRALRLLRSGHSLRLALEIEIEGGAAYTAQSPLGTILGAERPEEVVVVGAHLDSWGLGTGALDNGCNVAMLIDIARQIRRLGLTPRRTIRFALWNGEEQGLHGSWGYVRNRQEELDRHVVAMSFDIGSGRIDGFFTGGRPAVAEATRAALAPVEGLGPFAILDVPIVGTDNYDFMMEGVANLVASQESANYGPNYHARSDTFDKVDLEQLRLNAAIAASVIWGYASMDAPWGRQSAEEVEALVESTDLPDQMRGFNVWSAWEDGTRGRRSGTSSDTGTGAPSP